MERITKQEAEIIRQKFPNVHIRVVGKFAPARKKSRYVGSTRAVMKFLEEYRAGGITV